MTLLYFIAGGIAVALLALLVGITAWANFGSGSMSTGTLIALIAGIFIAGLVAWWAARKGANRWPY